MTAETAQLDAARPPERRYLTIMFIDLVDYTGLSERLDPEDLELLQRRYQQLALTIMERYGGFVANFVGDGILVYFGYPAAHEHDAERAVRAALELIDRLGHMDLTLEEGTGPALAVRIGVHTGLIVIGPELISSGASKPGGVGEAVNLAARLQLEAPRDGVVVTKETRQLIEGLFDFDNLGERPVKGLTRKVEVHHVLRSRPTAHPSEARLSRSTTHMVGRQAGMERLLDRWRLAQEQSRCQTVLVVGEAGLGKTRLVRELCSRPELAGATILQTHCHEIFARTPLYPVGSFIWRRAGLTVDDDQLARRRKLALLLHELGLASAENEEVIASFTLLAASTTLEAVAPTPTLFKRRQYDFIRSVLARTASRQPTVLWLEDVHWLDPSSAELLLEVVAGLAGMRVLIVLTSRLFPRAPNLPEPDEVIALEHLGPEDSHQLVTSIAGAHTLAEGVLRQAVEASEGVPLFLEQLVLSLLDEQARGSESNRRPSGLPLLLTEMLSERLDRRPGGRPIVQAAACVGRSFGINFLAALLEEKPERLAEPLEDLVEAEILQPRRYGAEIRYEFRHALLQRMAADSMLNAERRTMHSRIARVLQAERAHLPPVPEVLAHHLTEAGEFRDAIAAWLAAGVDAAKRSAHLEAIDHVKNALRLLDKIPEAELRYQLELKAQAALIGSIIATQGATSLELSRCCERGLELCSQSGAMAPLFPFLFGQFTFANCRGHIAEAGALADRFLELAERTEYHSGRVIGHRLRGMVLLGEGKAPGAKAELERSLGLYSPERDAASTHVFGQNTEVHSQAMLSLTLFCLGDVDRALKLGRDVLATADALRHPHSTAIALCYVGGWMFGLCDGTVHLLREAKRLVSLSEQHRLGGFRAHGMALLGWALCQSGQFEQGIALTTQAIAGFDGAEYRIAVSGYLANRADALRRTGKLAEAKASCARALDLMLESSCGWLEPELRRIDGLIEFELAPSNGEERLRDAVASAQNLAFPVFEQRCLLSLKQVLGTSRADPGIEARLQELTHLTDLSHALDTVVGSSGLVAETH